MPTITIGSVDYFSYQTVASVDDYAAAAIGANADAWAAATAANKAKAAVSATRLIDRQVWTGTLTDEAQDGQFPRTGLTYPDGSAVDPDTVPDRVLSAHSELSMALVAGSNVQDAASTTDLTRRLKAGSAEIEYFRSDTPPARWPQVVQELIGLWFGADNAGLAGSISTGTCRESGFTSELELDRGF